MLQNLFKKELINDLIGLVFPFPKKRKTHRLIFIYLFICRFEFVNLSYLILYWQKKLKIYIFFRSFLEVKKWLIPLECQSVCSAAVRGKHMTNLYNNCY